MPGASEEKSEMKKHSITVEKSARYFTLGNDAADVKTVLFVCHGYAQLADEFLKSFEKLSNENLLIVSPEGLHRFYTRGHTEVVASWMTKVEREDDIRDYVLFLDKVYAEVMRGISSNAKVIVLGFSQGAATVSRWSVMGQSKIDELILWCGSFPPDVHPTEVPKTIFLTLVTASNDKFVSAEQAREQLEKMKELNVNLRHVEFEGEHAMDVGALERLKLF
jgi:predicted esterase